MGTAKPRRLRQQDGRFGAEGGTPWGSGAGTKHSWLVALAELGSSACLGCHTHLGYSHLGCCSPGLLLQAVTRPCFLLPTHPAVARARM